MFRELFDASLSCNITEKIKNEDVGRVKNEPDISKSEYMYSRIGGKMDFRIRLKS